MTSTRAMIGRELNLFDESPEHCRQLTVKEPFITNSDLEKIREIDVNGIKSKTLSMLFDPEERGGLKRAMDRLRREASQAIDEGYSIPHSVGPWRGL